MDSIIDYGEMKLVMISQAKGKRYIPVDLILPSVVAVWIATLVEDSHRLVC